MIELIVRKKYKEKIEPFINKQIIKVLTGQRRVGKSYILKQTIQSIQQSNPKAHIIYINKEDIAFAEIRNAIDLYEYITKKKQDQGMNYVFIDEIQEIHEFEKALRSLLLLPEYDLYITGSNANLLSGELATFLSGRYIEIQVYSLSYAEFLEFHQLSNQQDALIAYLKYGGMPYLKHLELTDELAFGYLKSVYNTVVYRDVILRQEIRSTALMERLVQFLADNIGQLFSAKKISEYLKSQKTSIATSQIIQYISHLANAFLIYKVARYDIVGKRIFEIGEKFYFEDLGLRNSIIRFKTSDIGKIMENAVFHHLRYCGYEVNIGQLGNNEVDFIAQDKNQKIYIQVCYLLNEATTVQREFGNLEKIKDHFPKWVISMDEFTGTTPNGIKHIHLREFLLASPLLPRS